jgi:hypothetical protein
LREAQKPGFPLQFVRYAPEFRFYPLREQPTAIAGREKLMTISGARCSARFSAPARLPALQ